MDFERRPTRPNVRDTAPTSEYSTSSEEEAVRKPLLKLAGMDNRSLLSSKSSEGSGKDHKLTKDRHHASASSEASLLQPSPLHIVATNSPKATTSGPQESKGLSTLGDDRVRAPAPSDVQSGKASSRAVKSSVKRHQERLVDTEKGADAAGNSPRKDILPQSISATMGSSDAPKTGMTFLERARAARAQAQSSAVQQVALADKTAAVNKSRSSKTAMDVQVTEGEASKDTQAPLESKADSTAVEAPRSKPIRRRTIHAEPKSAPQAASLKEEECRGLAAPQQSGQENQTGSNPPTRSAREGSATSSDPESRLGRTVSPIKRGASTPSNGFAPLGTDLAVGRKTRSPAVLSRRSSFSGHSAETRSEEGDKRQSRLLKGIVVLVDVRDRNGNDASAPWTNVLREHGAKVASRIPSADPKRSLTHIIWKAGKPCTLSYLKSLALDKSPHLVGTNWIVQTLNDGVKADETHHLLEVGRDISQRKRVSMQTALPLDRQLPSSSSPINRPRPTARRRSTGAERKRMEEALQAALQHAPLLPSPLRQEHVPEEAV